MIDDPLFVERLNGQVCELLEMKQFADAIPLLELLSSHLPDDPKVFFELGRAFQETGQADKAVDQFRRVVRLVPLSADAHYQLAMSLGRSGDIEAARCSLEHALNIDHGHLRARISLGTVMHALGSPMVALDHLRKAQSRAPYDIELNVRLGRLFVELGNNEAARKLYMKALEVRPGHPEAVCGLASLYVYGGNPEAAYRLIEPLLQQKVVNVTVATTFAGICRPMRRCNEAVVLLERCFQQAVSVEDCSRLHFALGKLYDKEGAYHEAFQHFKQGNNKANRSYDAWTEARWFSDNISHLDAGFFVRAPRAPLRPGCVQPVFIVGLPRSGTTLVEQILGSHPSVYALGELTDLPTIAASLHLELGISEPYPQCLQQVNAETLIRMQRRYMERLASRLKKGVSIMTDKLPDNYKYLGLIQLLFPSAKVIHCIRDPMDTCLSSYFQYFSSGHLYSYNLSDLGMHYRLYERLMIHWHETLSLRILDFRYEELVSNPEEKIRSLLEFCELPWSSACLSFNNNIRDVMTASHDQVRQPMYDTSVERWRHYSDYLEPLRESLLNNSYDN